MRVLTSEFKNKEIDENRLLEYGFIKNKDNYIYEKNIYNDTFKVIITITKNDITSRIIEIDTNEEYIMADIENATGKFVGRIKDEYDKVIKKIMSSCTINNIFKSSEAKDIIKYIKEKYDDELEYLWEKFPNCAVWRNKKNNKWYGLIVNIEANKIGLDIDKKIDIIDLRYTGSDVNEIIDNKTFFKAYHMNKKNWVTIKLDEINEKELHRYIDNSYNKSIE